MKKISCIMLVDDNMDDNFYHARIIRKSGLVEEVIAIESGSEALAYLKSTDKKNTIPELIFVDINMPGMNGWEFLNELKELDPNNQFTKKIVMLTTSENSDDISKANRLGVTGFKTKPLTREMLEEIIQKYF